MLKFLAQGPSPIGIKQPKGVGIQVEPTGSGESYLKVITEGFIGILFTIAAIGVIIMVVWGIMDMILSSGDKEKLASARKKIYWAVFGMVLLAFAFLIIQVLGQVINFNPLGKLSLPKLNTSADCVFTVDKNGYHEDGTRIFLNPKTKLFAPGFNTSNFTHCQDIRVIIK